MGGAEMGEGIVIFGSAGAADDAGAAYFDSVRFSVGIPPEKRPASPGGPAILEGAF